MKAEEIVRLEVYEFSSTANNNTTNIETLYNPKIEEERLAGVCEPVWPLLVWPLLATWMLLGWVDVLGWLDVVRLAVVTLNWYS